MGLGMLLGGGIVALWGHHSPFLNNKMNVIIILSFIQGSLSECFVLSSPRLINHNISDFVCVCVSQDYLHYRQDLKLQIFFVSFVGLF
jgi:hypothetical protein